MFQQEAEMPAAIPGDELVAIHHIGSTAIPGMSAKPIIDLMPVGYNINRVDDFKPAMIERGYTPRGEFGISNRRYFVKFIKGSDPNRTHHIHIFQQGDAHALRHLNFRDYMIAHPKEIRRYAQLKIGLAQQFPHNVDGYVDSKDTFIKAVDKKALAWRKAGGEIRRGFNQSWVSFHSAKMKQKTGVQFSPSKSFHSANLALISGQFRAGLSE